jgi:hypothetical protein
MGVAPADGEASSREEEERPDSSAAPKMMSSTAPSRTPTLVDVRSMS